MKPHSRFPSFAARARAVLVALAASGALAMDLPVATPPIRELASPAAPGSGEPNLFAQQERVFLSWLEPRSGGGHALRFAVLERGARGFERWTEPRTILDGVNFFVNWADFPSLIVLPDGSLAAHALVRSGPGTYAYDVQVMRSADDGMTWRGPIIPHRDGTQSEHGFVSLFAAPGSGLAAVWLDGRDYAAHAATGSSNHAPPDAEMTVRYTTIAPDGRLGAEVLLDERACDCCQTDAAQTSRGTVLVYRDRAQDEVRDIWITRLAGGRWTRPRPVHRDGWQIPACPVNGPAVAARGARVAVAWFTAAADQPRVQLAFSRNAGDRFGRPIRVDDGDPAGRVDVLLLADGSALVSWLERVGNGAEVRVRRVHSGGRSGRATTVGASSAARASGFPRMVLAGADVVFAWTQPGDPARVRVATAQASAL